MNIKIKKNCCLFQICLIFFFVYTSKLNGKSLMFSFTKISKIEISYNSFPTSVTCVLTDSIGYYQWNRQNKICSHTLESVFAKEIWRIMEETYIYKNLQIIKKIEPRNGYRQICSDSSFSIRFYGANGDEMCDSFMYSELISGLYNVELTKEWKFITSFFQELSKVCQKYNDGWSERVLDCMPLSGFITDDIFINFIHDGHDGNLKPPSYPGGQIALMQFIYTHINKNTKNTALVHGDVWIRFKIGKDGSSSDAVIMKSLSDYQDHTALEILNKIPKWIPACIDNQPAEFYNLLLVHY